MPDTKNTTPAPRLRLSLDVWAVLFAFALTLLVRFGAIKQIPW
jgi:hypothetical protein